MGAEPSNRPIGEPPPVSHAIARTATAIWLGLWLLLTATARWIAPPLAELATRIEIAAGWVDVVAAPAAEAEEGR